MTNFRDLAAAVVALALLVGALSLGTTLTMFRKRRRQTRDGEESQGRRVIAEIPAGDDLLLFTEDSQYFHYGKEAIDKDRIASVRVLINGAPMAPRSSSAAPFASASRRSSRAPSSTPSNATSSSETARRDYQVVSGDFARWFAARARTNSRSDRRLIYRTRTASAGGASATMCRSARRHTARAT